MKMISVPTSVVMLAGSKKDAELFSTLGIKEEDYSEWNAKAERAAKKFLGSHTFDFLNHYQSVNRGISAVKEYLEYKIIKRKPKSLPKEIVKTLDSLLAGLEPRPVKEPSLTEQAAKLDKIISKADADFVEIFKYVKDNIKKWSKAFGRNPVVSYAKKDRLGVLALKFSSINVDTVKDVLKDKLGVRLRSIDNGIVKGKIRPLKGYDAIITELDEKKKMLIMRTQVTL